jgi:hypothetical protein
MPNPYEDLFGNTPPRAFGASLPPMPPEDEHVENQPEPLDEILSKNAQFHQQAEEFSGLLSRLRVVDHKVQNEVLALFVKTDNSHDQGSLANEKSYHELLCKKFQLIIKPMRQLAVLHLEAVRQFNSDIDDTYFSVEKEQSEVKSEKAQAVDAILLQRQILEEAVENLKILENALEACERRMKSYVNAGGINNLSASELSLLTSNRERLTSGREHEFDYSFFDINFLDKAAISFGIYQKETSSQYLQKLGKVFENRK